MLLILKGMFIMTKKLYKSNSDIKISGVCAGLADYFNLDATLVRLIFVALIFLGGPSIVVYIVCMFIMPMKPDYLEKSETTDYMEKNEKLSN